MTHQALDFKSIHEAYVDSVRRYLERLVSEGEAEDLTQDVFTRISRSLHTFRGEAKLSTWIYKIATNAAMDRMRQKARTGEEIPLDIAGDREDQNPWTGEIRTLDQQVIRKEMNDCIRNVVARLPEIYRTVIVLSEFEGFTNEEIAHILGLGMETVKIRLHRGRAKLKEELSRYCILYRDGRNELACDLKEGLTVPRSPRRKGPS